MKRKTKDEAAAEMLREQFAKMGMTEPCPLCSVPNWNVYHPPGKPCEKQPTHNTRPDAPE
jgi:hypothetical protein